MTLLPRSAAACWPEDTPVLLERCNFPPRGSSVVCAVSGGADSLAMLALARAAGCQALALHIDHGLRPGSRTEAAIVEEAARELGAAFQREAVVVGDGPDLEARARAARYDALPAGALVGHTADDQAETLLLNLLRGCGLDGLAGMRSEGGGRRGVLRPILALRRSETAAFVAALGLRVVKDPSNNELRFRRNQVRHEVLPLLAAVGARDPVPVLSRTAALLAEDAELLASWAEELDPTDVKVLRSVPKPLAARALRRWIRGEEGPEHYPPSRDELERAWRVVTGEARACELSGGRRLSRKGGRLSLKPG
ncbi:MAG TPA: tRNA lysidine(34) synthetase TilS [Acidimicrobiales bacterium]|nr:tRNA lysidine(34) synthetase TilS [Acidimicrobiales bacterium]